MPHLSRRGSDVAGPSIRRKGGGSPVARRAFSSWEGFIGPPIPSRRGRVTSPVRRPGRSRGGGVLLVSVRISRGGEANLPRHWPRRDGLLRRRSGYLGSEERRPDTSDLSRHTRSSPSRQLIHKDVNVTEHVLLMPALGSIGRILGFSRLAARATRCRFSMLWLGRPVGFARILDVSGCRVDRFDHFVLLVRSFLLTHLKVIPWPTFRKGIFYRRADGRTR